jgi:ribosomal silencing factor RsfS
MLYRTFSVHQKSDGDDAMGLAVHSALTSMNYFYKKFKPDKIVACLDHSSWRKKYTASEECVSKKPYKGHRRQNMTPSEQARYLKFLDYVGDVSTLLHDHTTIMTLKEKGLEADDFIAGFIQYRTSMYNTEDSFVIISGDKDFIQLLRYPKVTLFDPMTSKPRTLADWEGDADYFIFEKCIRGDTSDNVQNAYPGVRKKRIRKAYEEPFERENLMHHKWVMPDGREVMVGDLFKENKVLMDLEMQPKDIQKKMITNILRNEDNPGQYSHFHFLGFCGKYELKKVAEQAENFTRMLSL